MDNSTTGFCGGSPLWDEELLINNTFPEFTECFRSAVLSHVPSLWLWLVTPVHVRYVIRHRTEVTTAPCTLHIAKLAVCVLLTALSVTEGVLRVQDSHPALISAAFYLEVIIRSVTFLLAAVLTSISRKARIASPCVLFFFWTLSLLVNVVPVYHAVVSETTPSLDGHMIVLCILLGMLVVQFFLNCWAEPLYTDELAEKQKTSPEVYVSFLNKITFHWMTSFILVAYRRNAAA
ncbi:multidrug resistance-associated protein 1-like [Pomacea canaliculata]|uniref:multidrug resistance-associated protein 1-like n=1 Tax=Pomacea canaliculata TaxID=400727 RepID=UPI000D729097|nr:multidrug resistance-associated protein 1-like [Pomacea canaliculata]